MKYVYTVKVVPESPEYYPLGRYIPVAQFTSLIKAFWYVRKLRKLKLFKITLVCKEVNSSDAKEVHYEGYI